MTLGPFAETKEPALRLPREPRRGEQTQHKKKETKF